MSSLLSAPRTSATVIGDDGRRRTVARGFAAVFLDAVFLDAVFLDTGFLDALFADALRVVDRAALRGALFSALDRLTFFCLAIAPSR
jgi:hypothetical protein